jgi:NAD dependent epimerase/dehydratase family enzyme
MFGEMAKEVLLSGQRAMPRKLLEAGYNFHYPHAESALQETLS